MLETARSIPPATSLAIGAAGRVPNTSTILVRMAITHALLSKIRAMLSRIGDHDDSDWSITSTTKNNTTRVVIRYAYADTFYFIADIPNKKSAIRGTDEHDFSIDVAYVPGEASEQEVATLYGIHRLTDSCGEWARRVHDELNAGVVARRVAAQQGAIDDILSRLGNSETLTNEPFSKAEGEELKSTLDKLQAEMTAAISQQETDAKTRIDALQRELDGLRNDIDRLGKKGWLRKFSKWLQGAGAPVFEKLLSGAGAEVVKRLLPP